MNAKKLASQRKFGQTGENLRLALTRKGIKNAGCVASYLLYQFTENNARIRKDTAVGSKGKPFYNTEIRNGFDVWRDQLRKCEFISYHLHSSGKYMVYEAGKRLVKYINDIKSKNSEFITRPELNFEIGQAQQESDIRIKELQHNQAESNRKIEMLYKSLEYIINIIDKPATDEKIEELAKGPDGQYGKNSELLKLLKPSMDQVN